MPRTAVCPECENEQEIPANAKKVRCEECDTVFTPEAPQEEAAPARKKKRKRKPAEEDSSGSRRLLLLGGAAAGVVVLAIVAFFLIGSGEPDTLEARLEQLNSKDAAQVERAKAALDKAGAAAAPFLVKGLLGESDPARQHSLALLRKLGFLAKDELPNLRKGLRDPREPVQVACVTAIGYLGQGGRPADPDLVPLLSSDSATVRQAALRTFAIVGNPATIAKKVQELGTIALAETQPPGQRENAVRTLGEFRAAAVPTLTALLTAECTFENRGPGLIPGIPAPPRNPNTKLIRLAAEKLGSIGPEAKAALPTLQAALKFCTRPPTNTKLRISDGGVVREIDLGDPLADARGAIQSAIGNIAR